MTEQFVRPQVPGNALPIGEVGRPTGSGIGKTHGAASTYAAGCRCVDCRAAHRLYQRQNRSHNVAQRQRTLAAKYVRENLPHTWLRLRLVAEEEIDARNTASQVPPGGADKWQER